MYCSQCGELIEEGSKYCVKCGAFLMGTQKIANKPKFQKKGLMLIVIILSLMVIGIFVTCSIRPTNGIKVDGKMYTFSAENGIDNYEDINDGIISVTGLECYIHYPIGSDSSGREIAGGSAYIMRSSYNVDGKSGYEFVFEDDYETMDGISMKTTEREIQNKGYLYYQGSYQQLFSDKGKLDWSDIEKDYNKAVEKGSFKGLYYYDALTKFIEHRYIDGFGPQTYNWEKEKALWVMANAKLEEDLLRGDIEYYYIQQVDVDKGNKLVVWIYADGKNTKCWRENWLKED